MHYAFLIISIITETIATSALKATNGFTNLVPSAIVVVGYAATFYFLSLALQHIPVGIAYAVWSGLGIILIAGASWILYGQALDLPAIIGMALILTGVIILNVFSQTSAH